MWRAVDSPFRYDYGSIRSEKNPFLYLSYCMLHHFYNKHRTSRYLLVVLQVATIELIENVTLDILWQPDIPRSAPPQPGIGGSGNILPINYPIVFDVGAAKGK